MGRGCVADAGDSSTGRPVLARCLVPAVAVGGPPVVGLEKLTGFWESERDGPDEPLVVASDVVAVEGTTAVVRISVDYLGPDTSRWRDLWVLTFAQDGPAQRSRNGPSRPTSPTATDTRPLSGRPTLSPVRRSRGARSPVPPAR